MRGSAGEFRTACAPTGPLQIVRSSWLLWLVVLGASGVDLILGAPGGFYLLALAMAYMFGSNVWNAWVLIAEVSE